MRPWIRRSLLGCGGALLVAVLAVGAFLATERGHRVAAAVRLLLDTREDDALATGEDVLVYLEHHRNRCSLAAWDVGDEDAGVYFDADALRALASTVKVVPLALYGERLDTGAWDAGEPVTVADVERYYLPHTDGEAHPLAMADLDGGLTLDGVARAMIRFSDNAATDWLLHRLGREAVDEGAARLLGADQGPIHPLSGTLLLAQRDGGASDDVATAAWALSARLGDDEALRAELQARAREDGPGLSLQAQLELSHGLDNRASARSVARLMERVFADPRAGVAFARAQLAWPMAYDENRQDFALLATKGGSLPGTLTSAYFAETKRGRRRVLALFLHDLPFATWVALSQSFAQQKLERKLLLEDGALEQLHRRGW